MISREKCFEIIFAIDPDAERVPPGIETAMKAAYAEGQKDAKELLHYAHEEIKMWEEEHYNEHLADCPICKALKEKWCKTDAHIATRRPAIATGSSAKALTARTAGMV